MINPKTAAHQARIYVYELDNCAREFGFTAEEGWELCVASDTEKASIQKRYHPVMYVKVIPEILSELFNLVKNSLPQVGSGISNSMDQKNLPGRDLQYLIAYNPKRPIR